MIPTKSAAAQLKVSVQYLRRMAEAGRVPGAIRIGTGRRATWAFPLEPKIVAPEHKTP